jgi:tetratricopeptide (TPR) repeat protein
MALAVVGLLAIVFVAQRLSAPVPDERLITLKNTGLAYLEEDKIEEAIERFDELRRLAPNEPLAYANLAEAYRRAAKFAEAEEAIQKALVLEPNNPDILFLEARLALAVNDYERAEHAISKGLKANPDHIMLRNQSILILERTADPEVMNAHIIEEYQAILERRPQNLYALRQLIELLCIEGDFEAVRPYLHRLLETEIRWPEDAISYRDSLRDHLNEGRREEAMGTAMNTGNYLKPTAKHRQSAVDLAGAPPDNPLAPLTRFLTLDVEEAPTRPEAIQVSFMDATQGSGLTDLGRESSSATVTFADLEGDGTVEVIHASDRELVLLTRADTKDLKWTKFSTHSFGHPTQNKITSPIQPIVATADLDNDARQEILVGRGTNLFVLHSCPEGALIDITSNLDIDEWNPEGPIDAILALDVEHDGDLDIVVAAGPAIGFFQNNGNMSFTWRSDTIQGWSPEDRARDLDWADIDDDGDVDIIVSSDNRGFVVLDSLRGGRFTQKTTDGLTGPSLCGQTGDFDNDGRMDIAGVNPSGEVSAFLQDESGGFKAMPIGTHGNSGSKDGLSGASVKPFDFDNDGWLDVLVSAGGKTALYRNAGATDWTLDTSWDGVASGSRAAADTDGDGDLDLLLSGPGRTPIFLRNDGGGHAFQALTLSAQPTKNDKRNNSFGIGGVLEIRSGLLYQKRKIASPTSVIGLGPRASADVIRVIWTNGIPQHIIEPKPNQLINQIEILKGSCPFLFAWNGAEFQFVTDLLWRSPLGMKINDQTTASIVTTEDFVKIRGDQLKPVDGRYRLMITDELWETFFYDETHLLSVDHPEGTEILVDERFVAPVFPPFEIHVIDRVRTPISAVDNQMRDVLSIISDRDGKRLGDFGDGVCMGIAPYHFVEVDLGPWEEGADGSPTRVRLIASGWIQPTDTSLNIALSQSGTVRPQPLQISVSDGEGEWKLVEPNAGFPAGKLKTIVLDLTDRFPSDDHRVRIATNLEVYWDRIGFALGEPEGEIRKQQLSPAKATLQSRGFSEMIRRNGANPELPIYDRVRRYPRWRNMEGWCTAYGDVLELISEVDDRYVIMASGDELALEFNAPADPPTGWVRDFVLWGDGWVKDADLNTVESATVGPPPFHAMKAYPPDEDQARRVLRRRDWEDFHTRYVTADAFRDFLRSRGPK